MREPSRTADQAGQAAAHLPASAAPAWSSRPAGSRPATAPTGGSGGAARSASGPARASTASARSTPSTSSSTSAPTSWPTSCRRWSTPTWPTWPSLRRRPRRRPDQRRRLRASTARLSCSAGRRRRRPGRAAAAVRASKPAPSSRRLAVATISRARARTLSSAPVAAIRSQSASAAAASRPCRSTARIPGSAAAASISGSVTVPSSRSVPRALPVRSGGPATSRTSSSSWKARPTSAPKSRSALVVVAEQAGALEQRRRLQPAALEVALLGDRQVEGVLALGQLAAGERHRGVGEQRDRAAVAGVGEQGEGAREQQVAGGDGAVAARGGGDGREAAAQRRLVEDVVVDQGRHVDQLDRGRGAHRGLAARLAGAEQDQHRPQPLAAGRQRRRGVLAEQLAVAARSPRAAAPRPRRAAPAASGSRRPGPPSPAAARPSGRVTRGRRCGSR